MKCKVYVVKLKVEDGEESNVFEVARGAASVLLCGKHETLASSELGIDSGKECVPGRWPF